MPVFICCRNLCLFDCGFVGDGDSFCGETDSCKVGKVEEVGCDWDNSGIFFGNCASGVSAGSRGVPVGGEGDYTFAKAL